MMKYASLNTIIALFKHSESRSKRCESKGGTLAQIPEDKRFFIRCFLRKLNNICISEPYFGSLTSLNPKSANRRGSLNSLIHRPDLNPATSNLPSLRPEVRYSSHGGHVAASHAFENSGD